MYMPICSIIVYNIVVSLDSKIYKQIFHKAWKDQENESFFLNYEKPKLKIISIEKTRFCYFFCLKFPCLTVC